MGTRSKNQLKPKLAWAPDQRGSRPPMYWMAPQNIDNIICLPGQPGGRAAISFRVLRKGVVLVSTYEELMVILTVGLLIVAILNLKNK